MDILRKVKEFLGLTPEQQVCRIQFLMDQDDALLAEFRKSLWHRHHRRH